MTRLARIVLFFLRLAAKAYVNVRPPSSGGVCGGGVCFSFRAFGRTWCAKLTPITEAAP